MPETNTQVEPNNHISAIVDMRPDVVVRVALLGLAIGFVAWVLTWALAKYAVGPALCPTTGSHTACGSTDAIAGNIVLVVTAIAGMLGLVRLGVYRPMLIAIAVVLGLWGIGAWLSNIVWYEALGWSALVYMAAYVAFSWLVRPRNFIVVLIVLIALIASAHYISTL
jgi:hypothetical protein